MPGSLVILAALTSTGKTAMALQLSDACARKGLPVGIVTREMLASELAARLCGQIHGIPLRRLYGGDAEALAELDQANLTNPIQRLPIWLDHTSSRIEEIAARVTEWVRKHGVRVVVVDYLQLVSAEGETRNLEVAQVSRRLKQLALQHRIAILALSQFSRAAASGAATGDRPELHHLRDSGSLEQDADLVITLWRTPGQRDADGIDRPRELCLSLLKNRNGAIGNVYAEGNPLVFDVAIQRFREAAEVERQYGDNRATASPSPARARVARTVTSFADRAQPPT